MNGPHISPGPAEPALASIVPAPFHEWWDSVNIAPEGAPKDYRYNGVEETLTAIQSTLEQEGPFDLVVGFSQGATMVWTALLSRGASSERHGATRRLRTSQFALRGVVAGQAGTIGYRSDTAG